MVISVEIGEVTITFDPANPDMFGVKLYEEDCSIDTKDYYYGQGFLSELEEAIALFKSQSKSP